MDKEFGIGFGVGLLACVIFYEAVDTVLVDVFIRKPDDQVNGCINTHNYMNYHDEIYLMIVNVKQSLDSRASAARIKDNPFPAAMLWTFVLANT